MPVVQEVNEAQPQAQAEGRRHDVNRGVDEVRRRVDAEGDEQEREREHGHDDEEAGKGGRGVVPADPPPRPGSVNRIEVGREPDGRQPVAGVVDGVAHQALPEDEGQAHPIGDDQDDARQAERSAEALAGEHSGRDHEGDDDVDVPHGGVIAG